MMLILEMTSLKNFLKKLEKEVACDSSIPLLCIYLKGMNAWSQTDICTFMFIAALFTVAISGTNTNVHWWMNR